METDTARTYVIIQEGSGRLIGTFELRNPRQFHLGYGYVLARSFWGLGFMTEALTHVACWALSQPNIWRVGDFCDVENRASARVMEKAGFTCEGVARRWMIHPNISDAPRACLSYAKVRDEQSITPPSGM